MSSPGWPSNDRLIPGRAHRARGKERRPITERRATGEARELPVHGWRTPRHPGPGDRRPSYVPRDHAFSEADPVPAQNGQGLFDPEAARWIADEMIQALDPDELTLADPATRTTRPSTPPAAAPPRWGPWRPPPAGSRTTSPAGLIADAVAGRDPSEPFTVDATLHSASSIFGPVPDSPAEGTSRRTRIEGSILAADLGPLGPRGTEALHDPGGRGRSHYGGPWRRARVGARSAPAARSAGTNHPARPMAPRLAAAPPSTPPPSMLRHSPPAGGLHCPSSTSSSRRRAGSRRGGALIGSLLMLMLLATMLAGALVMSVDSSTASSRRLDRFEGKRAASSVNRLAAQEIWADYAVTVPEGFSPRLLDLRLHLEGIGLGDQAGQAPAPLEFAGRLGLAVDAADRWVLGDSIVESVLVHREDHGRNTQLHVTTVATASRGGERVTETLTDVFELGAPAWEGLDFTLLASNVNCIMCHTKVDDVRRVYALGDAVEGGGPVRARIGAIESFQIRHDPASLIAGTMYLGKDAVDEHGDPISDWSDFTFHAMALDGRGSVELDSFGNPTVVDLTPMDEADPEPFANLYTNYLGQEDPVDGALPETFPLPFTDDGGLDPATGEPDLEGEGNRRVDDLEFATTVASFSGSVSGGAIGVVLPGERIESESQARSLAGGTATGLGSVTSGSVVLTGTEDEPIRIEGQVAIDGDLIISGPIEGVGSIWVRGNIYVRGDLRYDDLEIGGQRAFGTGEDGRPNALGLTAGGNVVMGDMFREEWGRGGTADGTPSGAWNFTLEQAAIFNRGEWLKTQPRLPGKRVRVQVGVETRTRELFQTVSEPYMRDVRAWVATGETREVPVYENVQVGTREQPVYGTVVHNAGTPYERTERVQTGTETVPVHERVQTGTRTEDIREYVVVDRVPDTRDVRVPYEPRRFEEYEVPIHEWQTPMHDNPDYRGAGYLPRYYAFGEGDPVPIPTADGYFDPDKNRWVAPEMVPAWDADGLTLADPNDPEDPLLHPPEGAAPVIVTLEPTAGWISEGALRRLVLDELENRDPSDPFEVDATLYSSNSIFGVVPDDPDAGTAGKLRVQGALLAADVGLLGPRGTEINFDPRGKHVLAIVDETRLGLRMVGTLPAPPR